MNQVLELENQIKTAHLLLALRIKKTLTDEQRERLMRLRRHQAARANQRRGPGQPAHR